MYGKLTLCDKKLLKKCLLQVKANKNKVRSLDLLNNRLDSKMHDVQFHYNKSRYC